MPKKPTFLSESKWKVIGSVIAVLIPFITLIVYAAKQDVKIIQNEKSIVENTKKDEEDNKETKLFRKEVNEKLHKLDKNQEVIIYMLKQKKKGKNG